VIYINWLRIQFGLLDIMLGVIGLFFLMIRRPRYFCLLMGMYIVHLWFFTQYKAFDLDVFFIPTHFLWAIFILVIPSTSPPGVWPLTLGKLGPGGQINETVLLATLEVVNQSSTMERWLRIADLNYGLRF
jgi:hypothetical protein